MSSSRESILGASLALLRQGRSVSLDSAARAVGLTKPGVMYHFPTKEALMLGLVDYVVDAWLVELGSRIPGGSPWDAPVSERVRAYVDWCLSGECDPTNLVMLADPRLKGTLTARWSERFEPWYSPEAGMPGEAVRGLTAARMMAEGVWFTSAAGICPPDESELADLRAIAHELIDAAAPRTDT